MKIEQIIRHDIQWSAIISIQLRQLYIDAFIPNENFYKFTIIWKQKELLSSLCSNVLVFLLFESLVKIN